MSRQFWVYIVTNQTRTVLYTGMTNNIERRMHEHRSAEGSAFTGRYKTRHLVYYEEHSYVEDAIFREKQIKAGSRADKVRLIEGLNPAWDDLAKDW